MSEAASELEKLRAALAVAEGRAATAEAKLAKASAVVSASEAMIKALRRRPPALAAARTGS